MTSHPTEISTTLDSPAPRGSAELAAHIAARAESYFPTMPAGACRVEMTREHKRSNSEIYEFHLRNDQFERRLIVKLPFSSRTLKAAADARPDRPRSRPRPDPYLKGLYEYVALSRIHDHFSALDDPRFGAIRPLELLSRPYLLIMEKGPNSDLSHYLRRANRLQKPFLKYPLARAFANTGDWLRRFHRMPPPDHCRTGASPDEFRATGNRFLEFLVSHSGRPAHFQRLRRRFNEAANRLLPRQFESGLNHGDFAPRNILVEAEGRVTVFDTQAGWLSPIMEDVAHFLVALKASGPQVASRGLLFSPRALEHLEREFLRGYFEQDPPLALIRLFECQRVLEWWSSMIFGYQQERGLRRFAKRSRCLLWQGHLAKYLDQALRQIEQIPST